MYRSSPLQVLDMCKVCTEADRFEQNPAAGQIFRNRPGGQITPNRPAGQITPNRPAGQITLNRPAGQTGWLAGIKIVNEIRVCMMSPLVIRLCFGGSLEKFQYVPVVVFFIEYWDMNINN